MEVLPELLRAGSRLRHGRDEECRHTGIFPRVESLFIVSEITGDLRGHAAVGHRGSVRFEKYMYLILSVRTPRILKGEIRVGTDRDHGSVVAGNNRIPKRRTFLPVRKFCGTGTREQEHARMDVRDEERMPDANLSEFVISEALRGKVARRVSVFDQNRFARG